MLYSFIIPIYNRSEELRELLDSLTGLSLSGQEIEVLIVDDGSTEDLSSEVNAFESRLNLRYFKIANGGPASARNYGMQHAQGDYFIFLDSDVLVPQDYLKVVSFSLKENLLDCFGGPDAAHKSFTTTQKAINYAMTSWITTGGIRGKAANSKTFQPRSFNMGISRAVYRGLGGFSEMRYGEDIDFSSRIREAGYKVRLVPEAYVYHKRRTTFKAFFKQTFSFGTARPVLNKKFPETAKITFWFPSLFILGWLGTVILDLGLGQFYFEYLYVFYFLLVFLFSSIANRSFKVGVLSVVAVGVQFWGYGLGFLKSYFKL
ncbi:MAG: glycosyltransferase [Flavobacteriaceae bacterium]